jgi:hypothetical protein
MNREKTLEVIRGMKFMQRKEEAKRREMLEIQRQEELRRQTEDPPLSHDGMPHAGKRHTPRIIMDDRLPLASTAAGRLQFGVVLKKLPETPREEPTELYDEERVVDGTLKRTRDDDGDDPTMRRRFTVEESVRAPKLPRGLARDFTNKERESSSSDDELVFV